MVVAARFSPSSVNRDAALASRFAEAMVDTTGYEGISDPATALMKKDQSIMDYQETVEILQVSEKGGLVGALETCN